MKREAAEPASPAPSTVTVSTSSTWATGQTPQGSAAAQLIDVEMRKEQRLVRESEIQRLNWLITKAKSLDDGANPHHLNLNLAMYERDLEILYLTPLISTSTTPNSMLERKLLELDDAPVFPRGLIPHSPVSMFSLLPTASSPRILPRDFFEDVPSKLSDHDVQFVEEFDYSGQCDHASDGEDPDAFRNCPFPSFHVTHHTSHVTRHR
jgi:hypothetical protein